jgi:hypothetical protein
MTMRVVYGGVVFLSAFLLFVMEPMAAKQLLPLLGGSSAVWVTCLVFFQAVLLVGYVYAHWLSRQKRIWVHAVIAVGAVVVLLAPAVLGSILGSMGVSLELNWDPSARPVSTIFGMLAASIGLPFVLLSSTSPLLQVWWTRQMREQVPYRLFAVSNAGSLLALAMYPSLIEPYMSLATQRNCWVAAFILDVAISVWVGERALKRSPQTITAGEIAPAAADSGDHVSGKRRWMWFLLPMAASMQLAAVTSHLSQDIAAIPLLWVLPLGVYLLTFVVAFELPAWYQRSLVSRVMIVLLASLGYALSRVDTRLPVGLAVVFYMLEVFVTCWFCHAETYTLRPANAARSTEFYLTIAAGGVTGTFLIAIASPLVFRANYDLALAFLATAVLAAITTWEEGWSQRALWVTASALLLVTAVALHIQFSRNALMRARNFYGSLGVTAADYDDGGEGNTDASATGPVRVLMNGRIRHGMQMMSDADHRKMPTTYYGEDSGVGIALRNCCQGRPKRIGVVGLGVGTLAAYGQPGDTLRFYEINPLVEPIARNLFTYLRESRATITVVNGDGRLSLKREPPQNFDVLVVDAFTGDAIPLHLLTREAMEVYRSQLASGGVIAFHVSNSYVDLAPAIERVAEAENMQARVVESFPVPAEGAYRATWVLVSENAAFFSLPAVHAASMPVQRKPGLRTWTDDYSSLLPVMRLGR